MYKKEEKFELERKDWTLINEIASALEFSLPTELFPVYFGWDYNCCRFFNFDKEEKEFVNTYKRIRNKFTTPLKIAYGPDGVTEFSDKLILMLAISVYQNEPNRRIVSKTFDEFLKIFSTKNHSNDFVLDHKIVYNEGDFFDTISGVVLLTRDPYRDSDSTVIYDIGYIVNFNPYVLNSCIDPSSNTLAFRKYAFIKSVYSTEKKRQYYNYSRIYDTINRGFKKWEKAHKNKCFDEFFKYHAWDIIYDEALSGFDSDGIPDRARLERKLTTIFKNKLNDFEKEKICNDYLFGNKGKLSSGGYEL